MTTTKSNRVGTSFLKGVVPCLLAAALISGIILIAGVRTTFDALGNLFYMVPMLWLMQHGEAALNTLVFLAVTSLLTLACLLFRGAQGALPEMPLEPEKPNRDEFDDEKELEAAKESYARDLEEYETKKKEHADAEKALSPWQRVLHRVFGNPGSARYSPFFCVCFATLCLAFVCVALFMFSMPGLEVANDWKNYRAVLQGENSVKNLTFPGSRLQRAWEDGLEPTSVDKASWFRCRRYVLNHPSDALLSLSINGQEASVDACTWRSTNVIEWRRPS